MKPYKTVIYSFLVGGTFALIAQAILTFWQTVLVGTPMAFFVGGATLISMGVIGCILGGLACYQYVEEWATFGALRGWNIHDIARFAQACAALHSTKSGIREAMPFEAEVQKFLEIRE